MVTLLKIFLLTEKFEILVVNFIPTNANQGKVSTFVHRIQFQHNLLYKLLFLFIFIYLTYPLGQRVLIAEQNLYSN